jgi:hypothetical protein
MKVEIIIELPEEVTYLKTEDGKVTRKPKITRHCTCWNTSVDPSHVHAYKDAFLKSAPHLGKGVDNFVKAFFRELEMRGIANSQILYANYLDRLYRFSLATGVPVDELKQHHCVVQFRRYEGLHFNRS